MGGMVPLGSEKKAMIKKEKIGELNEEKKKK